MGKNKDLTPSEKENTTRWLGSGQTTLEISKKLLRDHRTVLKYVKNCINKRARADKGKRRKISGRKYTLVNRELAKNPLSTSKTIFDNANIICQSRTTRCSILQTMATVKSPGTQPPLKPHHKVARLAWAKTYMKVDFSRVMFTDECRATLDGPDGFSRGWVKLNQTPPIRLRRQQGGGGIMFWAALHGANIIGPFRIADGIKMNSASYTTFLTERVLPCIASMTRPDREKLIFMQDNAPSHASQYTKEFLANHGFVGGKLMNWPACSPDLNPIENYWSALKMKIYASGKQYSNRDELWQGILTACGQLDRGFIKILTQSMDSRLVKVYQHAGAYIKH